MPMETVVQSFSNNLRRVLAQAAELAGAEQKKTIEPAHLFYGLVNQAETSITNIASLKKRLKKKSAADSSSYQPMLSSTSKQLILNAATLAQSYNHPYVGTEHLLVSLLESRNPKVQNLFNGLELDSRQLNEHLRTLMNGSAKLLDVLDSLLSGNRKQSPGIQTQEHDECEHHEHEQRDEKHPAQKERRVTALEFFTTLLTTPEVSSKLDPCIGRADEIDRLTRILARRTKNNPVLVGPPGVGKTAIVEGLAKRIATGDVDDFLKKKKIYSLDLAMLVAGTTFRGELEIRLKHLIDEVKADQNAILFIDEIHNLVGAGSAHGSLDAANIMKPALARGDLRCIGATTFQEYKRFIEDDAALERRFQQLSVQAPSKEEAKKILHGLVGAYEKHHGILISPEAIDASVELSDRYITEKFLPDKAIDVLDEASAKLRLITHARQEQKFSYAQAKIQSLTKQELPPAATSSLSSNGLAARELKLKELLTSLKTTFDATSSGTQETLLADHVAEVVAQTTGIPIVRLLEDQKEKLLALEEHLSKRLIGQDHVKQTVSHFIRRARAGLTRRGRPIASFLFLGPTGVGKTELARVLSDEIFGPNGLIKLDMSEFSESFTIARLIGAPSGYIGYKEGGRLTEGIRQRPFSLVLFDEIEKAHPRVLQVLLQILDDGCLTDAAGKQVDFSNTIIVMTSNIGAKFFSQKGAIGFEESSQATAISSKAVLGELKQFLNPELISRIDQTAIFHSLESPHIKQIIELHLKNLSERLAREHIKLSWTPSVSALLTNDIAKKESGARDVRHYIESELENKIAQLVLSSPRREQSPYCIHLDKKRGIIEVKQV